MKNAAISKARYSNIALEEVGDGAVKEDDKALLLEGGGLQSASPRANRSTYASSPIFRFLSLEEQFLIDNRLTLRTMGLFWFIYALLVIVSVITSFKIHHDRSPVSGKAILYS